MGVFSTQAKSDQKLKITAVKIDGKSNEYTYSWSELGSQTPTQLQKNGELSKLDSQGIDPKFLYFQNRNDSLNHFQFFELIAQRKMLWRFQPTGNCK